jgi:uncharacterized membrane protein
MENLLEITSIPVIVAIVYGAVELFKKYVTAEKWIKLIPVFAAALGVVLGIVAYYAVPAIMPAENVLVAILVGGASGLAATGTHQVVKQLTAKDGKATITEIVEDVVDATIGDTPQGEIIKDVVDVVKDALTDDKKEEAVVEEK